MRHGQEVHAVPPAPEVLAQLHADYLRYREKTKKAISFKKYLKQIGFTDPTPSPPPTGRQLAVERPSADKTTRAGRGTPASPSYTKEPIPLLVTARRPEPRFSHLGRGRRSPLVKLIALRRPVGDQL
jgi:hypothetical protein